VITDVELQAMESAGDARSLAIVARDLRHKLDLAALEVHQLRATVARWQAVAVAAKNLIDQAVTADEFMRSIREVTRP
jgi:hypothetical protein